MNIIRISPKIGNDGVFRFLQCVKRKFFFWKEPVLTYDAREAIKGLSDDEANDLAHWLSKKFSDCEVSVLDENEFEKMKEHQFFVIENNMFGTAYYSEEEFVREGNRGRQLPKFELDIMKADFLKYKEMAATTLNRIRQTHFARVRIRPVYLTIRNDFTVPCILFALKNKQAKRVRYLKGYDLDGKSSDRVYFVDDMSKAWKVTIPMSEKVVEDIHQKHKVFIVETHLYDGTNIQPQNFRYKRNHFISDFKFKTL